MSSVTFDRLFRSESLVFRALENNAEDKAFIHNTWVNDPTSWAQGDPGLLVPLSQKYVGNLVERLSSLLLSVAICLPGDATLDPSSKPVPIGILSLSADPSLRHHRSCTLGLNISATHQGKGYGTEAINWALDWAFRVAGLHSVAIFCFSYNVGALRLYEKLGFIKEGVQRERIYYDLKWHDQFMYSMLDRDWLALREARKETK